MGRLQRSRQLLRLRRKIKKALRHAFFASSRENSLDRRRRPAFYAGCGEMVEILGESRSILQNFAPPAQDRGRRLTFCGEAQNSCAITFCVFETQKEAAGNS